jgi:hypothetical protein
MAFAMAREESDAPALQGSRPHRPGRHAVRRLVQSAVDVRQVGQAIDTGPADDGERDGIAIRTGVHSA